MTSSYPLQRIDIVAFGIIFTEAQDQEEEIEDSASKLSH